MTETKVCLRVVAPTRTVDLLRPRFLAVLATAIVLFTAGTADAQIQRAIIHSQRTPGLPGYWTNDIFIDFDGQYTGSQMIVELWSGEIYQEPTLGRFQHMAPNSALFPIFPNLQWDSFLANGGPTTQDSVGDFGLGGAAINIDPDFMGQGSERRPVFSDELIDQSWNPAGGNVIEDLERFMVARLTLSDDAIGTFRILASANQQIGVPEIVFANNGYVSLAGPSGAETLIWQGTFFYPAEPSTAVLFGIGLAAISMLNSGRGRRRARESGGRGA